MNRVRGVATPSSHAAGAACRSESANWRLRPPQIASGDGEQALELQQQLTAAATAVARDDGWAPLSAVGSLVAKNSPSFDPRNYDFQKLGELVRRQPYMEVKEIPFGDAAPNVHLYVRLRKS